MRGLFIACAAGALFAISAAAQPAIRSSLGVVNASSNTSDVARGSWFVVYGTGLGPASIVVASGAPHPSQLSSTQVTFTPAAGGAQVSALLWYTLSTQVAAMLPSSTPAGAYDVKVTYNGQTSAAQRVAVVERNFGFATQAQNGLGPAQATYGGLDLNRFTTGQIDKWATRPAKVGDVIVLWGTGLGADSASDTTGGTSGDQTSAAQVKVMVDNVEVTPAYAGRSNGSPGLDQINFTVPSGVSPNCFATLYVKAGGRISNFGSLAIAAAGQSACPSSSLTSAQLTQLDQGATLTIGTLSLSKLGLKVTVPVLGTIDQTSESASGSFARYSISDVATSNFAFTQTGSCFVSKRVGTTGDIVSGALPTALDAGTKLTLNGPNASNIALPGTAGVYGATLYNSGFSGIGASGTPTIAQGSYTIAGTGGANIGAFSANLTVPGTFTWSNQSSIANPVPRNAPLNVTWTGGTSGLVAITGMSGTATGGTATNPTYDATVFVCIAPASAGSFTVPSSVLTQLPQASSDVTSATTSGALLVVAVPDPSQGSFTAPLVGGGTLDHGYFTYSIGSMKTTGWN